MSIKGLDPLLSSLLGNRQTSPTYFDAPPQMPWFVGFWSQANKKRYTIVVRLSLNGWQRTTYSIHSYPNAKDRQDPQIIQGGVNLYRGNRYYPYVNVFLIKLLP